MEKDKKEKIGSILFLSWFILTIIFAVGLKGNTYITLFIFGQAFFVFGLIGLFSEENITREEYPIFLFVLVGFTLIEISFIGLINSEYLKEMIPSVISNSIMLFGLLILLFEKKYKIRYKKRRLSNFKTTKKGNIKLYKRSIKYNIRDLNLIERKKEENVNFIYEVEYIKINKDNFAHNLGIFFIIFGLFIRIICL